MELNHSNLCDIAVRWLKRPSSGGGHGCHIAVSEVRSGYSGEVPDAIGFRAAGYIDDGSVVVEVYSITISETCGVSVVFPGGSGGG